MTKANKRQLLVKVANDMIKIGLDVKIDHKKGMVLILGDKIKVAVSSGALFIGCYFCCI